MPTRRRPRAAGLTLVALLAAVPAEAAGGPGAFGPLLLGLAVLVLAAKLGGLAAERLRQPPVLGELLVGIVAGNLLPPLTGGEGVEFVRADPTLAFLAQLGVLILLFDVGLEADVKALARVGPSAALVATVGVVAPLGLGFGAAAWLLPDRPALVWVFVGATLSATSVGITARVLKDLGAMARRESQIILGAAIVDDVLGLVLLAVVQGAAVAAATGAAAVSPLTVAGILARAVLFLGGAVVLGHFLSGPLIGLVARTRHRDLMVPLGLALCFVFAYAAEGIGLADIIGAFAAGLFLDPYGRGVRTSSEEATLAELLYPLSTVFVPFFFVLTGLQVRVAGLLEPSILGLAAVLTLCAFAGKLACAAAVVDRGVNRLAVGIGMVPRGEVGLVFAGIGAATTLGGAPILSQELFSAMVLMVVVTTVAAPAGLRRALR
jgi:Kef-type K+ transport system membrane component KefB